MKGTPPGDVVEYGRRRGLVVAGVMLATLLQVLDTTIVNVALPTIQGNLGASLDEATWIVTGYIISAVIVIPLTPWLQMRFGRRGYYVVAILGFTATSAACGLSTSFNELVFFRILQGACGGGLIATGQAVLRDTFPAKDLAKSQALNAVGAIVGPTIGPTLGGILTDALSWNWVFYINIVPGLVSATLLFMYLRNPAGPRKAPVDGVGLGLLALGLGSLQYVLNEGERRGWVGDERIVVLSLLATAGLAAFAWRELFVATLRNPAIRTFLQHHGSAPLLYHMIVEQATTLAFADANRVLAVLTAAAIPLILLLRRSSAARHVSTPAFTAAE